MKSGAGPSGANGRVRSTQQRAVANARRIAGPYRLCVETDAEGFRFITGWYGQNEWYCDGLECWACPVPGQSPVAVYTDHPHLFKKLWALPGVNRYQTGDTERRAIFPPDVQHVATTIKLGTGARSHRRKPAGGESSPHTERLQNRRSDDR